MRREAHANARDASRRTHTTPRVCVRVSSTTTTHMQLVSPRSKGSVGEKRSGCVQAYLMSFTLETFQLLKSPSKKLAPWNMYLGGEDEGGCAESEGEEGGTGQRERCIPPPSTHKATGVGCAQLATCP